ncbi:hypothetical protein STENM36S_03790 [Streptomyces tendae]
MGVRLARADRDGWIHPAGLRMLQLWQAQLDLLGVGGLGLAADRPLATTAGTMLDTLAARGLLIDHRRYGGPVHLDGPRWACRCASWSARTATPTTCCRSCAS